MLSDGRRDDPDGPLMDDRLRPMMIESAMLIVACHRMAYSMVVAAISRWNDRLQWMLLNEGGILQLNDQQNKARSSNARETHKRRK